MEKANLFIVFVGLCVSTPPSDANESAAKDISGNALKEYKFSFTTGNS